jgi:hypothetical protein
MNRNEDVELGNNIFIFEYFVVQCNTLSYNKTLCRATEIRFRRKNKNKNIRFKLVLFMK